MARVCRKRRRSWDIMEPPVGCKYTSSRGRLEAARHTEQDRVVRESCVAVRAAGDIRNAGPPVTPYRPGSVQREGIEPARVKQTGIDRYHVSRPAEPKTLANQIAN